VARYPKARRAILVRRLLAFGASQLGRSSNLRPADRANGFSMTARGTFVFCAPTVIAWSMRSGRGLTMEELRAVLRGQRDRPSQ